MTTDLFFLFKFLLLAATSFLIAIAWCPFLIRALVHYRLGKQIRDSETAPIFSELHKKKSGTPTMGGIVIWGTTLIVTLIGLVLNITFPESPIARLNFLTRSQTLLPLGALIAAALVGLLDDYYNIKRLGPKGGGLSMTHKLLIYSLIAAVGAYWFAVKLEWDLLHIPFYGDVNVGLWYVPIFFLVIVAASHSVNLADGLDGLAGGTLLVAFAAYAAIAVMQGKEDLAVFLGVLGGALLAFLWFNINPARFFMGDTGAMSLGVVLGILAMLTNTALLLPIIGVVFVAESVSVIVQTFFKKILGRKLFKSTPLHHHFEASGWAEPTVVMRFWVVSMVAAAIGVVLFIADRTILS